MSKSSGIFVDPAAAVDDYGVDAVRYFLLRNMPFDQDGDFTWEIFAARYNADLANDLGNLLNRTLRLVNAHFNGAAPPAGEPGESEQALAQFAAERLERMHALMPRYELHLALDEPMSLIRETNRYLSERQPWDLAKRGDLGGAGTVLYHAMEALRWAGAMLSPFIPSAVKNLRAQLGVSAVNFDGLVWGGLEAGKPIGEAMPLFPRIDYESGGGNARSTKKQAESEGAG